MTSATSDLAGETLPPAGKILGRLGLGHVVVVLLSIVLTMGVLVYSKVQLDSRVEARFDVAKEQTVRLIRDGMQKYEDALWAGVSTLDSHNNDMTLDQWRAFSQLLRIEERHPGINGIGVIHFVGPDEMAAYLAKRRAERPDFAISPAHDNALSMPISFIEPEDINIEAVGLDIAFETNRRTAALASRDTGTAQISGPITLVQDADATPGFLFMAPFYAHEQAQDEAARKDQAIGLVYAPFVVRNLMEGMLSKEQRDLRFSITDAGKTIYDEFAEQDPTLDPDPMFADQLSIDLYGRTWTLDLQSNLNFRAGNTYPQSTVVLIAGLIIEGLVIAMLWMLAGANAKTVAYAERVTSDLRQEKQRLAHSNEELEQFAYVASHDLKTPIRGIGGLTEMLREDLQEYMNSPDADPEVRQNLDRIDARVARMSELTRGILEFSRVTSPNEETPPLVLADAFSAMTADFELREDQITLSSEVATVSADSFNLRRVLENLVGNAIKYHEDEDALHIDVRVTRIPQRLQFEVSDNGPGIDQRYHERVFEVFQTLRKADDPESTGIGLAIVKKLVERQGGAIALISQPGEGATFRFDWPAKNRDTSKPKMERAA